MNKEVPFEIGHLYSRNDIFELFDVPLNQRKGGNWFTGYNKYQGDWFIFAGLNTPGRTGHQYKNEFIGNDLVWYGKTDSRLDQPSIQSMINSEGNIYIFTRNDSRNPYFTYRGNGRVKKYFNTTPVKIIWTFDDPRENHPEILPEEITQPTKYLEGAVKKIYVNVYERNVEARQKCIDHYGLSCVVCGFNFNKFYGEIGKDFIHVHHLIPLNEIKEEYEVDPIKDLRPVCPNCHAMIHKRNPAYTIEELKKLISKK